MEDKILCVDCGSKFVFTDGERRFFDGKGLAYPKRCKKCREAKRALKKERGEL